MKKIPIVFEHDGKRLRGYFSPVVCGGSGLYHLMAGNFFCGQLVKLPDGTWRFGGNLNTGDLERLGPWFGQQVEAYLAKVSTQPAASGELIYQRGEKRYILAWQLVSRNDREEVYQISPRDNPTKAFRLTNNRPLIRGRFGLKHRKIDWTNTAPLGMNVGTVEKIIEELVKQIGT